MKTKLTGLVIGLTILGTFSSPVAAEPNSLFNSVLPQLKRQIRIPIALPKELPHTFQQSNLGVKLREVSSKGYTITVYSSPDCEANVCFKGAFYAEPATADRISWFKHLDPVRLQGGITGYFRPISCGASCAPANVAWVRHGTVYSISLLMRSDDQKVQQSVLISLANSALQQTFRPR